jgi:hypothetical protein
MSLFLFLQRFVVQQLRKEIVSKQSLMPSNVKVSLCLRNEMLGPPSGVSMGALLP